MKNYWNKINTLGFSLFMAAALSACEPSAEDKSVNYVLTDEKTQSRLEHQPPLSFNSSQQNETLIKVDEKKSFQEMDGFGFTLTGGSAGHLLEMDADNRQKLLHELFGTGDGEIGINYLRISVAASDLNEHVFFYHDLKEGKKDDDFENFDLGQDKLDVIPVLKEILAINPDLKIMGSPWSPPPYMKDSKDSRGGSLLPEYYDAYAAYLARYIQEMEKEGITIDALTVQNEPLHPGNNPSLLMEAPQQAEFIKNHLGPEFEKQQISTKIIIYDHNADRPDYPISILDDPEAKKYIDGSAFHLYAGEIAALSEVYDAHPDKNIYFTEQWMGGPGDFQEDFVFHIRELTIGATRNWSKTVLEWNLTSNPDYTPYTDRGGCNICLGGITLDGNEVIRNAAYYVVGHASKYVRTGSHRINSSEVEGLPNVAFSTPDGKKVLIVLNDTEEMKKFDIQSGDAYFSSTLNPKAVATYVW